MSLWFAIAMIVVASAFFKSPLPRAMAESMRRGSQGDPRLVEMVEHLAEDVRLLRDDVMDLQERLDFTERALADVRRRDVLPGR